MDVVSVVCAVLVRDGRVLAARRRSGTDSASFGGWEFPGGKVEVGESLEQALRRELDEELGISVSTMWHFDTVEQEKHGWHMRLEAFICPVGDGCAPVLRKHEEFRWIERGSLPSLGWLAADRVIAERIGVCWDQLFVPVHL